MSLSNLIILNERILIEPSGEMKTNAGLVIPQNLKDDKKQQTSCGFVIKTGNGYPVFNNMGGEEVWENSNRTLIKFMPLQVRVGDFVYYLSEHAVEVYFEQKKYNVIPEYLVMIIDRNIKSEIAKLLGE
jgi:co-chaperonin GroES (HSP10)